MKTSPFNAMDYLDTPEAVEIYRAEMRAEAVRSHKPTSFFVSRQDRSFPEYVNAENGGDTTIWQKQNFGHLD